MSAAYPSPAPADLLALARVDLPSYAAAMWPEVELPSHQGLLVEHLEAIEASRIRRLIVSAPPRHGKSLLASTYFPAWFLGRHPSRSLIFASYSQELAEDFGRKVRNLLSSPMHGAIFPGFKLSDDSQASHRLSTTAGGAFYAVGRGGSITGRGGDLVLIDDPLKGWEEAQSATVRRLLQSWYRADVYTRLHPSAAVVLISTRWHEDDLAGMLLREHADEGWTVLSLPAIAEEGDPLGRPEGAALWPEKFPREVLEQIRANIGSATFAALYQGHPAALEGAIFKRRWWARYEERPEQFEQVVLSADTAFSEKQTADYSVVTTWGKARTGFYLLHVWRERAGFPDLKRALVSLAREWKPHAVLVEDRASGQSLIQSLKAETSLPVRAVKADSSKTIRAAAVTPLVEAGRVLLPTSAPWLEAYLDELSSFPAAPHDDQVDSTTQVLNFFRSSGPGYRAISVDWI